MRQRDEDPVILAAAPPDSVFERNAAPQPFDRERADEQDDPRAHERELLFEPRRAESDLSRRWTPVPRSALRFPREAFRDRGAVWQMRFVDARMREPPPQLRTGAARERQSGGELDGARSLTHDHHAVARLAVDDGIGVRDESGRDALRACANASMQACELALASGPHVLTF